MNTMPNLHKPGVHVLRRRDAGGPKLIKGLGWQLWLWPAWFVLAMIIGTMGAERTALWMIVAQLAVAAVGALWPR
ncbi:MAG TPA: hypothetical protein VG838_00680 [Opitutaceae bacterium]|nr:hypothetical protein [Opitutaceae bacterium]